MTWFTIYREQRRDEGEEKKETTSNAEAKVTK
jgi:hypothetical protein